MTRGCPMTIRRVPRSAPEPVRWPGRGASGEHRSGQPAVGQPPLPWHAESADPALNGRGPARRATPVPTECFGQSWAEPLLPGLPDPASWSARLAPALIEALLRRRPISQLSPVLDASVLTALTVRVRRRPWRQRWQLSALHLHRVNQGTVEATAVIRDPRGRVGAIAFRLSAAGTRWLCTALEISAVE